MGLQMKRAMEIVRKTSPYVLYRAAIYGALCLGVIVYLLLLAIIGAVFGAGAFWALLVISVALAWLLDVGSFIGEYVFYRQKAGHIALIAEIITEGQLPIGISQMKWARGHVLHYFDGMGLLPEIRRLLRDILRAVNRTRFDAAQVPPAPGLEGGTKLAEHVVEFSQGYIEEAAIAYIFKSKNENVFDSARSALLIYGQCWKTVLGNAVTLTLLSYAFVLVASIAFLVPLGILSLLLPDDWTIVRFVLFAIGVFLGFAAKWAFFDPVAGASTALLFLGESTVAAPDPEWEKTLETVAPAFTELTAKAAEKAGAPSPDADAPPSRGRRSAKDKSEAHPQPAGETGLPTDGDNE